MLPRVKSTVPNIGIRSIGLFVAHLQKQINNPTQLREGIEPTSRNFHSPALPLCYLSYINPEVINYLSIQSPLTPVTTSNLMLE